MWYSTHPAIRTTQLELESLALKLGQFIFSQACGVYVYRNNAGWGFCCKSVLETNKLVLKIGLFTLAV